MRGRRRVAHPLACVIGSMDLVRPLGLAGIHCATVARPGARTRYSRFTRAVVEWADPWKDPEELLERLLAFGRAQPAPPTLYYEGDWDLLLVSRFRDRLRRAFRFVVADAALVEALVDKARFQELAARAGLPVPRSVRLAAEGSASPPDLSFPVVVKPLTRQMATWTPLGETGKAVRVESREELEQVAARLAAARVDALAQELVPGGEERIESYHVYVDSAGSIAGEFTGKKIRTHPPEFGYSTALEITASDEVRSLGRELVERLGLRGVAKLDFKRAPDGRLLLLEVNPRFNLWHHPGAKAGVNIPALVHSDLCGVPRPPVHPVRAGVRWYDAADFRAAREAGVPPARWLRFALTAEAKSAFAWDDPLPLVAASLARLSPQVRRARTSSATGTTATTPG